MLFEAETISTLEENNSYWIFKLFVGQNSITYNPFKKKVDIQVYL